MKHFINTKGSVPTHTVHRHGKGFTLIEMMVVVAIVAILAALAAPSFNDYIAKNRVKAAAEEIYGLVLQAKSEGPIRDVHTSVNTNTGSIPWCVGFTVTASIDAPTYCDCTNTTSCIIPVAGSNVLQVVNGTNYPGVTIGETFTGTTGTGTTFNRLRGTTASTDSSAGTITVSSGNWQLNIGHLRKYEKIARLNG